MACNTVVFNETFSKYGRLEFQTKFGRNKTLTFKKSGRGFYFLDLQSGNFKFNIGLDELDELFTLRGQLEVLTGCFEKEPQQVQRQERSLEEANMVENISPYRPPTPVTPPSENQTGIENIPPPPPPPPSPQFQLTPTIRNDMPFSPVRPRTPVPAFNRTPLQEIYPIPVKVSRKRPSTLVRGDTVKKPRYGDVPTNDLYNFSAEEIQEFFMPMN